MTRPGAYRAISTDPTGETFTPMEFAIGPWDDRFQHGGPVAALLARAMDRVGTPVQGRIGRVVVEIWRPVAMTDVRVRAGVVRPGRKVTLLEAEMFQCSASGEEIVVATAHAWRLATSDTDEAGYLPDPALTPADDAELRAPLQDLPTSWKRGFVGGIDWAVRSPIGRRGEPTTAWARPRFDLVEGEPITGLEAVTMVADSANGIGARVDPMRWTFMNTDLTVHLHTEPRGPWVGLVAETTIGRDGLGMSAAIVHDEHGPVGRVAQVLLVEAR